MSSIYQVLVFGAPSDAQFAAFRTSVGKVISDFGLTIDKDVTLTRGYPTNFSPILATVAVFFGASGVIFDEHLELIRLDIPIIPLVSSVDRVGSELPAGLRAINALPLDIGDPGLTKPAVIALQCLGLLPRERRVFLSYRRHDSRQVALQLFEAISAVQFEVFLDTHAVSPAEDFQAVLWHRLCDSDVVVMLDTPGYFDSRWTTAEWGRAIAKHISILQVVWPGHKRSRFSTLATTLDLQYDDLQDGCLSDAVIKSITLQVETLRSKSIAVRNANITGEIRSAVEALGGTIEGIGQRRGILLSLQTGDSIIAYPSVGVPTAVTIHEAFTNSYPRPAAVVYDHVGLHPQWLTHLDWLGSSISAVRWIRSREAAWALADWPRN